MLGATWFDFLEALEAWWFDCTEFVNDGGKHKPDTRFERRGHLVYQWACNFTNVDAGQLWDLTWYIDSHADDRGDRYGFPPVPLVTINQQVERCLGPFLYLHELAIKKVAEESSTPNGANNNQLFSGRVPANSDIVDLAVRIDAARGDGRTRIEIAREFTGGNESKAKSLLADIRRRVRQGTCNLPSEQ